MMAAAIGGGEKMELSMINGIKVEIGGKKYVAPPLGLAGLKVWMALREGFAEKSPGEQFEINVEVVHAALVRNYPDLELDDVKKDIHAHEVMEIAAVLPALLEKSGLKQGEPERGAKRPKRSTGKASTVE
jgi:hypothetical protein